MVESVFQHVESGFQHLRIWDRPSGTENNMYDKNSTLTRRRRVNTAVSRRLYAGRNPARVGLVGKEYPVE